MATLSFFMLASSNLVQAPCLSYGNLPVVREIDRDSNDASKGRNDNAFQVEEAGNCSGGEIERLRVKVLSESSASLNHQKSSVRRSRNLSSNHLEAAVYRHLSPLIVRRTRW